MFGKRPPKPTGRTIDGEVEPVVLDLSAVEQPPTQADEAQVEPVLAMAIAAHFGIPLDSISGFVLAVEHVQENEVTLSSAWSLGVPVWRLRAFAAELRNHLASL